MLNKREFSSHEKKIIWVLLMLSNSIGIIYIVCESMNTKYTSQYLYGQNGKV